MNRVAIIAVAVLIVSAFFLFDNARAVEERAVVLTEAQIQGIKDRCIASKVELNKLHSADALLRVNLGQNYMSLSSRLMQPLNSRIALNGLDGIELSQTTVSYNEAFDDFRRNYIRYEESVAAALSINCQNQPIEYYGAIENARRLRAELRESVVRLNELVSQYQTQFSRFTSRVSGDEN